MLGTIIYVFDHTFVCVCVCVFDHTLVCRKVIYFLCTFLFSHLEIDPQSNDSFYEQQEKMNEIS